MKKFLILMLVLGIASAANAQPVWSISVSTTGPNQTGGVHFDPGPTIILNISDTIWIGVNTAGVAAPGHFDSVMAILAEPGPIQDPDGEWSVQPNPSAFVYIPPALPVVAPGVGAFNTYIGYVAAQAADFWVLTNSEASPVVVGSGLHADYQYHCKGMGGADGGLVVIALIDAWNGVTMDTLTITQIPEPMTIILLGLGGLFLRRRR